MSLRDREVLDLLRDEPELLAIADAVSDTENGPRQLRPFRAVGAVALAAAAIFVLVLAAPWDRGGGGRGSVLDRALAAIDSKGAVVHMTMRMDVTRGGRTFPSVVTESFYDKQQGLVRVISRSGGKVVGDYTTVAVEDEFSFFPGLLEGASFYKQALANGDARIVGQGVLGRSSRLLARAREGWRPDPPHRHRPRHLPTGGLSRPEPRRDSCRGAGRDPRFRLCLRRSGGLRQRRLGPRDGARASAPIVVRPRRAWTRSSRTRQTRPTRAERSPRSARGQTGPSS